MQEKVIIYQIFTRLFGNRNLTHKECGTVVENGCGKMNDIDADALKLIKNLGVTHVWFTGIIRHASQTDYSDYGIPVQHAAIVKGKAGSPYAITDYYDVDPDLAEDVDRRRRMEEWEALIQRTHDAGMKVVMDFVPNHVAREYHSICKPAGVRDLGEDDDKNMHFSPYNNFYYCWGESLDLSAICSDAGYEECPAKATGNDHFDNRPGRNDWYETVKLNYGIDYCDAGGRSEHFNPTPDTWLKMTDILLFWASKGVDAFRCDMAEMVPTAFWNYATTKLKTKYPELKFIGEVYDPGRYRNYIAAGFDLLYDKVGMYDCLRDVICGNRKAEDISRQWKTNSDISSHMLYFLENHDEQRIASDFFACNPWKAIPAHIICSMLQTNPYMIYAGQELGERGMDKEGFSGVDGRTTIFDYWALETLVCGFYSRRKRSKLERELSSVYQNILQIASKEAAIREGQMFDLMYVNPHLGDKQFAFLRKHKEEVVLIVVNFSDSQAVCDVVIPQHAFDYLRMAEENVIATDLISREKHPLQLACNKSVSINVQAYGGKVLKWKTKMEEVLFNEHNKEEFPPAHTAEHLLNQLMVRMFGCERSRNAHIERKKSKITYILDHKPSRQEEKAIEQGMNELIAADMPVTYEAVTRDKIPAGVKLDRLPDNASEKIRLVKIGDFDLCPCIGKHVRSTSQIGRFEILGTNWDELNHSFRIRFKVIQ